MPALFVASNQHASVVEGWVASLAAAGAPVRHVSAWSGPDDVGRRHANSVNLDPFLLGPGLGLKAHLAQHYSGTSDTLLVVSLDPATQPLLPEAGVVLLVWQPQVPSQLLDQVQNALAAAPALLADGAAAVRGLLLVDASPSLTLSVTHKALEGAGLSALARKPTVIASRTSSAPAAAVQALQQLADALPAPPAPPPAPPASAGAVVRIAVARDDAFGPVFHENLSLLHQAGAQLLFFSPLYDTTLPAGVSCLYLSSGGPLEPERWQQLATNRPLLAAVRAFCDVGGMVLAEGAGLLYLSRTMELQEDDGAAQHRVHDMAGVLPFKTRLLPEPQCAAVQLTVTSGNPLLPAGARPRGYLCATASIVLVEERQLLLGLGLGLGGVGAGPGKGGTSPFSTTYEATIMPSAKPNKVGQQAQGQQEGVEGGEPGPAQPEGYSVQNVLASSCLLYLPSEPGLAAHLVRRCSCVDAAALAVGMAQQLGCSTAAVTSSKLQLQLQAALASKDGSRASSRRQSIQDVSAWGATFGSTGGGGGGDRSTGSTASGMLGHSHHHHHHASHYQVPAPQLQNQQHNNNNHYSQQQQHAFGSACGTPMIGAGGGGNSPRNHSLQLLHSSSASALSLGLSAPARHSLCGPMGLQHPHQQQQHQQHQQQQEPSASSSTSSMLPQGWRPSHEAPYYAGPSNLARQQWLLQQQLAGVAVGGGSAASMSLSPCSTASAFTTAAASLRLEMPEPPAAAAGAMELDGPSSCGSSAGACSGVRWGGGGEQLPTVMERSSSCNNYNSPGAGGGADDDNFSHGLPAHAAAMHHAASAGSITSAGYGGSPAGPGYGAYSLDLARQSYGRPGGQYDDARSVSGWSNSGAGHGTAGWSPHGGGSGGAGAVVAGRHGSMQMLAPLANGGGASHSGGVVCCAPGACEALVAMGLGNRLAGIGSDCDHPPDVCASRRVVLAWVAPEEAPQGAAARGIRVVLPGTAAAAAGAGGSFLAAAAAGGRGAPRPSVDRGGANRGGFGGGGGRVLLVDELSLRQEPPGLLVLPDPAELNDAECGQLEQALVETGLVNPGGAPGGACCVLHVGCRSLVDVMDLTMELGAAVGEPQAASMLLERLQARLRRVAAAVAAAAAGGGGGSVGLAGGTTGGGSGGAGRLGCAPGSGASAAALGAVAAAAAAVAVGGIPMSLALAPPGRSPRVLVLQSLQPLVEPGRWVPEMLAMAGASACLTLPGGADVALSWQDVRERAAPDVLIILTPPADGAAAGTSCATPSHHHTGAGTHTGAGAQTHAGCGGGGAAVAGGLNEQLAALAAQPGWWCLPAVRSSQVYLLQSAYCVRPGPRLVDGVELLARLLLPPGRFSSARKVPTGAVMRLSLAPGQRCRATLLPSYFVAYSP